MKMCVHVCGGGPNVCFGSVDQVSRDSSRAKS